MNRDTVEKKGLKSYEFNDYKFKSKASKRCRKAMRRRYKAKSRQNYKKEIAELREVASFE